AGECPQHDPCAGIDKDAGEQGDRGCRCGKSAECPHMTDSANQSRRKIAAGDEAARPARPEKTERCGAESFELSAQGKEKCVEPRGRQLECRTEKQRDD